MLESMTGYGSAERVLDGVKILVELRSVNNRFAEIGVKLPRQLLSYELEVRDLVRSRFQRGKISVYVQVQMDESEPLQSSVNPEKAKACRALLDRLADAAGVKAEVSLDHLLRFSEVFESAASPLDDSEALWALVKPVAVEAVEKLKEMRRREGEELLRDFAERIAEIESTLSLVSTLSEGNLESVRRKLAAKVEAVAGKEIAYSRDRLEMELVLSADRLDITEEMTRFRSHNKFFLEEMHNDESGTGRKLNFLLQEQLREANTIASKSQSAEVSQKVVHIKEELEKIREQLQNIE